MLLVRTAMSSVLRTAMGGAALWGMPANALPITTPTTTVNTGGTLPVLTNAGAVQTIKLNAPRTVLQYSGFTVATGETVNFRFDSRSDLAVVHSTSSAIQIDGTLNSFVGAGSTYGGNVWLLSAAGVFFGAGARVDVGGLLASTSIPTDLLDGNGLVRPNSAVLTPTTLAFDFGDGAGAVTVAGGAQITGHGGTLAFIAPSVTTGKGAVIGGASGSVGNTAVLYGAAQAYTVRFMQEASNDLDLLDFEVPGLTAGSTAALPLQLAGTTAAGNVYIASVSRADAVRAVLDAQGDIGAVSAGLEGGTIVLTAGGGIANRAAAPLFTDGINRQDISATGAISAAHDVTVTATGDINLPGTVTAGGSIRLRGLNVSATSLTAGEDIVVRGGDEVGSTAGSGYGYGYGGHYQAEGGQLQIASATAGDDVLGTTWNGDTEFGSVKLAGTGGDLAGDPLGILDAAGDGHRLRLTTTGDSGDVYLGRDGEFRGGQSSPSFAFENPIDTLDIGTNGVVSLDAIGAVGVTLLGNATIHDAVARQGLATFGATAAINVGTVTAVGGIGVEGTSASVGTATTSLDENGNGLIVVHGLTSASIANANAATDVLVVADNGNASVGVAHAGDDVIIRAYGGSASLASATVGVSIGEGSEAPDHNANEYSFGEGGLVTLFPGRSFDFDGNGRVIDIAAETSAFAPVFNLLPPPPAPGAGDVFLGLGTGTISGAEHVFLDAGHDIVVDLIGAPTVDEAFAGHDISAVADAIVINDLEAGGSASVTARSGDAHVDYVATALDLSLVAANGLAHMGDAHVGQDFLLSGKTVELGSLTGYSNPGYGYGCYGYGGNGSITPTRDITILASAGGFTYDQSLTATRDLTINVSGDLLVSQLDLEQPAAVLTAGDDVRLHGATVTVDTIDTTGTGPDTEADGSNIVVGGGAVTVYQAASANDILVDSPGLVELGTGFFATAANDIIIHAADIEYGALDAGRDLKLTATAGTLTVKGFGTSELSSGRDVLIDVSGDLVAGSLAAVRDLTLAAATITVQADAENAGTVIAGRDLTATARTGALVITDAEAGDDVHLAGLTIDVDTVRSTGTGGDSEGDGSNIFANGGTVTLEQAVAATDIQVVGTGVVTVGTGAAGEQIGSVGDYFAQAAQDILITGASVLVGPLDAGRDVGLTATTGGIEALDSIFAGRDVHANAAGAGSFGGFVSAGQDIGLTALTLEAVDLDAERDITATAGSIDIGSASSRRDILVTATSGDAHVGSAEVKRDLTVLAALGLAAVGDAQVGGNLLMTGKNVSLGSLDGYTDSGYGGNGYGGYGYGGEGGYGYGGTFTLTQNATLTATAGNVFGDASLFVANDVLLSATGNIVLGDIGAGNDVIATAGGALELGAVSGGRDVRLEGGTLATGGIDAGRDLSLTTTASGITVGDLTAVRDLTLDAFADLNAGNVGAGRDLVLAGANVTAVNATAGGDVTATARTGTLTLATVSAGDDARLDGVTLALGQVTATGLGSDSEADGFNIVLTGGTIGASQLSAATDIDVIGTGAVILGQATAGQDVTVAGATVDEALQLSGRDVSVTSGGAFTATAGLNATRDLHLTAGTTLDYATLTAARDLFLTGASVTGGSATATRDLTVMATLGITGDLFQAGRNLVLDPNQPIVAGTAIAGGNATLIGSSIGVGTLTVGGTTFAQATAGGISFATFHGTGDAVLIATGKVDLGDVTAAALRIVGGDLDVRNSLVASTLAVETPGNMIIGGTAGQGETGFRLAAADMARLKVSGIASFYAGVTTAANDGQVADGNLTIQDFGYNPADLPRIAFFADRSHIVDVTGHVLPTTNGGAVQIGDSNVNGRFRPASIYVSGGLGSAELVANCFGKIVGLASLSMFAVNDIIFGAADFRGVIQSTDAGAIDLGAGAPGVPAGPADDRLFVVSARFNVDAGGKIVSQNTASRTGEYAGMFITGIGAAGQTVSVGNARAIDLSGSFVDGTNALRSGPTAAKDNELGPGGVNGGVFRFNGCIVGGGDCTGQPGANPSEALRIEAYQTPRPVDITDGPLTTVLVIDQQLDGLDVLTVDNDGNVIVIKKKPGQ
ncbi:filamentous hemagglutinin N-terminal domain-containing protein [Sphingosinicellaceae bacterium]|nr:filamentous hemagglutinin N-terminal domain-containing protein [Sphingosinicellaceae bacterium]